MKPLNLASGQLIVPYSAHVKPRWSQSSAHLHISVHVTCSQTAMDHLIRAIRAAGSSPTWLCTLNTGYRCMKLLHYCQLPGVSTTMAIQILHRYIIP